MTAECLCQELKPPPPWQLSGTSRCRTIRRETDDPCHRSRARMSISAVADLVRLTATTSRDALNEVAKHRVDVLENRSAIWSALIRSWRMPEATQLYRLDKPFTLPRRDLARCALRAERAQKILIKGMAREWRRGLLCQERPRRHPDSAPKTRAALVQGPQAARAPTHARASVTGGQECSPIQPQFMAAVTCSLRIGWGRMT